jgi:hypothetical protein
MNTMFSSFRLKSFKMFLSFLLLGICSSMMTMSAYAQAGVSISPLISDLKFESGGEYERSIRVRNLSDEDIYTVEVDSQDVEIDDDNSVVFLDFASKGNMSKSGASWFTFSEEQSFDLQPGEVRDYVFTIEVPEEVRDGDYYASFNVDYSVLDSNGSRSLNGVSVHQSLGALFLIQVNNEQEDEILSFIENYDFSDMTFSPEGDGVLVSSEVYNNSLKYLRLSALVTITTPDGEIYYQQQGKPVRVFPGRSKIIQHSFPRTYLDSSQDFVMKYAVSDTSYTTQYYEDEIDLDWLSDSGQVNMWFYLSSFKSLILLAIVLISLVLVYVKRGVLRSLFVKITSVKKKRKK